MEENEFVSMLNEKIQSLIQQRQQITSNLLDGDWHSNVIKESIEDGLNRLEELAQTQELNVEQELLSILDQIPSLVKSVWSNAATQTRAYDNEISRWKEMSAYYSQFLENKKKEEEGKKKEEEGKKKEEIETERQRNEIASGEISEPTRMDAIRRQTGEAPPMRLSRFRKLSSEIDNEETSDPDDSRG